MHETHHTVLCKTDLDEIPGNNMQHVCTVKMVVHYAVTVSSELMCVDGGRDWFTGSTL
jgi:hypothetical protein